MSRHRTIKPDFWCSEQVMLLSREARLLFIGIWTHADDEGRIKASPMAIKAQVFPGDTDVDRALVASWLEELVSGGLMEAYRNGESVYVHVTGWHKHQKISHPAPPKCPDPQDESSERITPPEFSGVLRSSHVVLRPEREIRERERGNSDAESSTPAAPPKSAKETTASAAKSALREATKRLSAEFGFDVPPDASLKHWQVGAKKALSLAEKGLGAPEAAERVVRSALERFKAGKSNTYGFALQDCVPTIRDVPANTNGKALSESTLRALREAEEAKAAGELFR